MAGKVRIEGQREFVRALRRLDGDLPKAMRVALNGAAQLVVDEARPDVPRLSGAAARSLRVASTSSAVRVAAGGARAPYYPWLDFGGRVGRNRATRRRFYPDGRYIYPALARVQPDFERVLAEALTSTARRAGLDVT